ncbi:AAA family ATPase [Rhodopirellula sp. JC740]|uniref:AAA family ATPase n=1 Tax=Rhodopirellula halodulae TaxID=2894198 RepID=A0ABS8NB64_9BACT|nr:MULTISPECIES: AAA family ATPase [unclassified Rhodopirellula]MCC9640790.1 AAA family ATPase [Rhodopirellula sp. JC740]MCC9655574.1 AAA family ATPase [Rhodopirellula sp. JC737]
MPVLLMINLKGGVGKTASTVAIAETLAEQGYKTLVIDADHQSMAGELLLGEKRMLQCEKGKRTLHDVFLEMCSDDFELADLRNFIAQDTSNVETVCDYLDVIPCSFRIDDFYNNAFRSKRKTGLFDTERELFDHLKKQMPGVKAWLNQLYDFVIVDCPPSIAMQVKMFLRIADGCVIPSIPDQLSVRGSANLVDRLRRYRVDTIGTLWTLYRQQTSLHRMMVNEPYSKLPTPFDAVIPNATQLATAVDPRELATVKSNCDAKYSRQFASRYRDLCGEMISRLRNLGVVVEERQEELICL